MPVPEICLPRTVTTVKGSVDSAVLKTLATYVLKKLVEGVEDAETLVPVQKCCRSLKNAFITDVTTPFRKQLKIDNTMDDCDACVFQNFQVFTKIVEGNGLLALIVSGDVANSTV
ncbi:unnamed protein product [Phytophthora fragariaefolia]|uniref:Unnamed protein product n=1 Tax=Phytophthora fragariaefolia TaxID=1490495 RepID=A0A9W6X625_9STRA|nr:unnamed protein product [Phytophthora fragariaefolia]